MSDVVSSVRIPALLEKLWEGEFLIPKFQREFVWSISDVSALISSVIMGRPIGMITLWEQPDSSGLELEHVSLPQPVDDDGEPEYYGNNSERPKKVFAVLDGRQRSTAIAIAFGGLKASDARRRFAGSFFLNVATKEESERVVFRKSKDLEKWGLTTIYNQISEGLYPFALNDAYDSLDDQWMEYQALVKDAKSYVDGKLPDENELNRRSQIIKTAFKGIINTTLATYSVSKEHDLGTICDIFEKLNQTGTKVSTIDLIHSFLYADTRESQARPFLLRDWIRELGQTDGAVGWADPEDRPELIAQFVTAGYLAELNPPEPRTVGADSSPIRSVKSGDLLKTPPAQWLAIRDKTSQFASYIGGFQEAVAKTRFPYSLCPYPISASIYVALRWTNEVDSRGWGIDRIDALYRAFFWRNALRKRYDQGFLTQMSTDLSKLGELLVSSPNFDNFGEWAKHCNKTLDALVGGLPEEDYIINEILEPRPTGAIKNALLLAIISKAKRDILEPDKLIDFIENKTGKVDIHHLFPKKWIDDNIGHDELQKWSTDLLGDKNCIANLTPMLSQSNQKWKAKLPWKALNDAGVDPSTHGPTLESHFIGGSVYTKLMSGYEGLPEFWSDRANSIAKYIRSMSNVSA